MRLRLGRSQPTTEQSLTALTVPERLTPSCTSCNATKRHLWPLSAVLALMARLRELAAGGS